MQAPLAAQLSAMFDREESGRQLPYGPALDLGCGSGIHAVELAVRGWQLMGVDLAPDALRTAAERARKAGVDVHFVRGDVTALRAAGVGSEFRLVLDFGCFHGLNDAQREAMGREVNAVAADDVTLLMVAFSSGRRGPLPRGASREDIEATYPGWKVTDEEAFDVSMPRMLKNTDMHWYRLHRE